MMKVRPTIIGLVLVLLGFAALLYGNRTYLRDVPKTVSDTFHVGMEVRNESFWSYDFRLEASTLVMGDCVVYSSLTNQSTDIAFLVLDRVNFGHWRQRQSGVQYVIKLPQAHAKFNFTFTTTRNDTYYFVFDNYYSSIKKTVSLNVRYQYVKIVKESHTDYAPTYAATILIALGAISLTYGLLKRPEIRWA